MRVLTDVFDDPLCSTLRCHVSTTSNIHDMVAILFSVDQFNVQTVPKAFETFQDTKVFVRPSPSLCETVHLIVPTLYDDATHELARHDVRTIHIEGCHSLLEGLLLLRVIFDMPIDESLRILSDDELTLSYARISNVSGKYRISVNDGELVMENDTPYLYWQRFSVPLCNMVRDCDTLRPRIESALLEIKVCCRRVGCDFNRLF